MKNVLIGFGMIAASAAQAAPAPVVIEARAIQAAEVVAVTVKKNTKNYCINGPCYKVVSYNVYAKVEASNACLMAYEFVKEETIRVDNTLEIKLSGVLTDTMCPMHYEPVYKTVLVATLPEPRPVQISVNGKLAK